MASSTNYRAPTFTQTLRLDNGQRPVKHCQTDDFRARKMRAVADSEFAVAAATATTRLRTNYGAASTEIAHAS
jgi:hypothetical protein